MQQVTLMSIGTMGTAHIQKLVLLGMIRKQSPIPIRMVYVHIVEQKNRKNMYMSMESRSLAGRMILEAVQQHLHVLTMTINRQ